jgi:bifunctional non-homologous end joining protein LigD
LTIEQRKSERKGRVFLDYLRNAYAQTAIAPYAIRPKPAATVATLLDWDELDSNLTSDKYTLKNVFRCLSQEQVGRE